MMTSDYIQEDHHNHHHYLGQNSRPEQKIPDSDRLFSSPNAASLLIPSSGASSFNNEFIKTKNISGESISNDPFLEMVSDCELTPDFFQQQALDQHQCFFATPGNFQLFSPPLESRSFDFSDSSNECLSAPSVLDTSYFPMPAQQSSSSTPAPYYSSINSQELMWPSSLKLSNNSVYHSPSSISSSPSSSFSAISRSATGLNSIKGKSPFVIMWLQTNFEPFEGVSMPRSLLYTHYYESCLANAIEPVNAASFGKIIRSVFPNLRTRRLGTRGHSKYHYYGIRMKNTPTNPDVHPGFANTFSFSFPSLSSPNGEGFSPSLKHPKLQYKISSETNAPSNLYSPTYPPVPRACGPSMQHNPNLVSCVTSNPPSIDKFASMLLKATSTYLEGMQVENLDFFRLGLQHHTTLLLSLILREEFFQFEDEFSLYWLTVFPKAFPDFFLVQKEEKSMKYLSLASTIRQFDHISFSVIQDCFLSSFWILGVSAFQLESIRLFCTKTLPSLIVLLMRGYLGETVVHFDSDGWPVCKKSPSSQSILPLNLVLMKLEAFKKLSSLLLKRTSLCSLASSLSASFISLNMLPKDESAQLDEAAETADSDSNQSLKKHIRFLANEIRTEIRRQIIKDENLVTDPSSYSLDNMTPLVIPENILSYLIDSIESLFAVSPHTQKSAFDWESWSSYLESIIDAETGAEHHHVEEDSENNAQLIKRKSNQHQSLIDLSEGGLDLIEKSIQRFLIQWSFVASIFMDQLSKLEVFRQPESNCLKSSCDEIGDALLSEYVHFSTLESHSTVPAVPSPVSKKALDVSKEENQSFPVIKAILETLHMITEEYLLYLVEKRLDEAKESLNVRLASVLSENSHNLHPMHKRPERKERKKTQRAVKGSTDEGVANLNTDDLRAELSKTLTLASISSTSTAAAGLKTT